MNLSEIHVAVFTTGEAAYWVVTGVLVVVGLVVLAWLLGKSSGRAEGRAEAAAEQRARDAADVDKAVTEFGPLRTALRPEQGRSLWRIK